MVRQTSPLLTLVGLALLTSVLLVDSASGNTELHQSTSPHRHERRDEFFNNTVFTAYPDCSKNCLEDSVRDTTCAAHKDDAKLYSDCVCRRSDAFQTAAAACIARRCLDELCSSARKFSDECASSGGSTVTYDIWLAQGNLTNCVSMSTP